MTTLGIIGCGNMGRAIVQGVLDGGVLDPSALLVAEVEAEARKRAAAMGAPVTADAAEAAGCSQVMLAVKPQTFPEVAAAVAPLRCSTVVISIMAGLSSGRIRDALGPEARVVRVMPNTPGQIRLGISAIALGAGARPGDDELARRVFGAIGDIVHVPEEQIYAVTAVSGGGPAYVCLLAEAMEQAAITMGIEPDAARRLVVHTVRGAGALLVQTGEEPGVLREAVTSPGGTTAEALKVMYQRNMPRIVVDGLVAARDRGVEIDR
ncbi:MAG: pyrroline-5-carboxylate reductase [Planctomycetota bacterium]|jgi:pyrroline-5-carboxylate reductase